MCSNRGLMHECFQGNTKSFNNLEIMSYKEWNYHLERKTNDLLLVRKLEQCVIRYFFITFITLKDPTESWQRNMVQCLRSKQRAYPATACWGSACPSPPLSELLSYQWLSSLFLLSILPLFHWPFRFKLLRHVRIPLAATRYPAYRWNQTIQVWTLTQEGSNQNEEYSQWWGLTSHTDWEWRSKPI